MIEKSSTDVERTRSTYVESVTYSRIVVIVYLSLSASDCVSLDEFIDKDCVYSHRGRSLAQQHGLLLSCFILMKFF